ncbi:hypothetical protein [Burkholderia gladioli]|uniref:Inclusion body family protein n=1 Tax=Burkholderia gladioli TaxID=28095 RepID=A0AAW3F902_BURGA|nr:hypothetical protein [Burkholderia gladioli]AJW98232.1 inclusion body family protein [Burkholderia gladioli]ASD77688.1 hypothetical protein CEJ98_00790 [Burkholderia gladioli pv. gladioli]AWY53402.1 hypothetical protein A8H28_19235 [Burkholderia gladioli pv. gladioli]KGC16927.1 inclusion body family protein [Burkholderia gladioli]MBU9269414.1 hypothetical protein [Burkholderia gladioli]
MANIYVDVLVNVAKAIDENNLSKYVFMVDSTGYSGDGSEGSNELRTKCENGDTIVWSAVSINPGDSVSILGFTGAAIPGMVNPQRYPQYDGTVWGGRVNSAGSNIQYSITMLLENNHQMTFDPFITATNPS